MRAWKLAAGLFCWLVRSFAPLSAAFSFASLQILLIVDADRVVRLAASGTGAQSVISVGECTPPGSGSVWLCLLFALWGLKRQGLSRRGFRPCRGLWLPVAPAPGP